MHEIGEYRFQRFVTELMGYEPDIATSDEYGTRGQEDFGADVIARRNGADGQEVASCKCYERTSATQLRDWSDEFLEHWDDHWKLQGIRRFVLATTASNSGSRSVQDQVTAERDRFARIGVEYEMWGPPALVRKVRPYRAIARTYLGEFWETQICGPRTEQGLATSTSSVIVSTALIEQVSALQGRLSAQAMQAAERATEDLRAGRLDAVKALIDGQRSEETWSQLDGHTRTKVARLEASLAIRQGDLDGAERLSAEADAIEAQDEPRLRAHLAAERDGPLAGLEVLGEVTSIAGRQLRASLRIMTKDLDGAEQDIEFLRVNAPEDAETCRMEAFLALARRDPEGALAHVQRAERIAPAWNAVRQMGGMARYACALSPSLEADWYLAPNAFDGAFVREDARSRELLEEALALFDTLVAAEPDFIHHRFWRLAVLASLRSRRDRTREDAEDLLVRSDHDATVVAWCMFRSIDVDLNTSERALGDRYRDGADETSVRVFGMLLARSDDRERALEVLRNSLDRQAADSQSEALAWIERLESLEGAGGEAVGVHAAFRRAEADGNWKPVSERLATLMSRVPPDPEGLALSESLAALGHFALLKPHVDQLLEFATASAIRIAAFVAYKTSDPAKALRILEERSDAFGDGLPLEMRRLRADALASAGDVPAALREADAIAGSGSPRDRLFRAELLVQTGNVRGALPGVQTALEAGLLTGNRALSWSRMVRTEDPVLARRLLERAIETGIDDRLTGAALHDALSLQMAEHAASLIPRIIERANEGEAGFASLTVDDLPKFITEQQAHAEGVERLYLDGAIPVHLRFGREPFEFAMIHLGPNTTPDGGLRPWPIRHGARPAAVDYEFGWQSLRLHLDVTALLVAARLELLEVVESHPNGVAIAADLPMALMAMENACRERSDAIVAERVLSAGLTPTGLDSVVVVRVVAEGGEGEAEFEIPQPFVSLPDLVASLLAREAIGAEDAAHVTDGLRTREGSTMAPDGSAIGLDAMSLQRLAAFDLLPAVTARYNVRCDGASLDQARWARDQAGVARSAFDLLGRLRARVATGIETGIYKVLPRARADRGEDDDSSDDGDTHMSRCLADVISAPAGEGAVAWVDDRLVTGYANTATMPVVGVSDVLNLLRKEGRISAARHAATLNSLRAAGALFVVPSPEELLAALLPAASRGQELVETPDLVTLRRSLALAALHERNLAIRTPDSPPHERPDEVVPAQVAMRLLPNCLREVWLNEQLSFDQTIAISDWLWLNARRTHVGRVFPGDDQAASQNLFEVLQIAHCLDQAVDVGRLNDARRQARLSYLNWFWTRAVLPLLEVDPEFRRRLSKYLVDFYAEMDGSYANRSGRDRRILHLLLAARVQRLPEPIQADLYGDQRMAAFGKSMERVTVGRMSFDAGSFWRGVRQALRFGSARIHHRPNPRRRLKTVVLHRDGDRIRFGGGVKALVGDPTLRLAILEGQARKDAIGEIVSELALGAAETGRVIQEAVDATTVDRTVRIIRDAALKSAKSRYRDVASALGQRQRVRLDAFGPAPFDSVLASVGLDAEKPFRESLRDARAASDAADGPLGLVLTAGIPVLRHSAAIVSLRERSVTERARTPMALVHVLAAAVEGGGDGDEVRDLAGRLVSSIEARGSLFVTLLRFSLFHFLRDPRWRSADPAFALAAIWGHADRMLDIAIGGGLASEPLETAIRKAEPNIAGADLLRLHPAPPDMAWPSRMSAAALLHHGLGAAFGDLDLGASLCEALLERASEAQLRHVAGIVAPEIWLLLRRADWPNAMESFLALSPIGLDGTVFDRAATRDNLINGALDVLDGDPDDQDAWHQLGAFSSGGVDEGQFSRILALVKADPARLVRLVAGGMDRQIWRAVIGPIAWREPAMARQLALRLAAVCRHLDEYRPLRSDLPISSEGVMEELVELAALVAQASGIDREATFADLLVGYSAEWPVLARALHAVAGNIAARTPSGRAEEFWKAQNQLALR